MTPFVMGAALLVVLTLAFLLYPLLRARLPESRNDLNETNLAVLRDDLAELERERSDGSLSEADFEQASHELKRRLLDESESTGAVATAVTVAGKPAVITAIVLVILLPLAAGLAYYKLGEPRALDPKALEAKPEITPQQIEGMVSKLAERLKTNPDDTQGWVMLARSYKVLRRYSESAEAYSHAGPVVDQDAMLLADYAEALYLSGEGNWQGKPLELIERSLKLDPDQPQALLMAGAAARDRGDVQAAATYWRRLLALAEPGSEEAKALEEAIDKTLAAPVPQK